MPAELDRDYESTHLAGAYPFLLGLGVAWFLALLLIFNFGYAAWRWLTQEPDIILGK